MSGKKFDKGKRESSLNPKGPKILVDQLLTDSAYGKYEPMNWQKVDNGRKRYTDALDRHMTADAGDEGLIEEEVWDPDSGHMHLTAVGCNAMFLLWLRMKELKDEGLPWKVPTKEELMKLEGSIICQCGNGDVEKVKVSKKLVIENVVCTWLKCKKCGEIYPRMLP
jgi:hypothetical protein